MKNTKVNITKPGDSRVLKLVQETLPELKENQVLIETEACGVAFADIMMREGLYPNVPRKNITPGYDIVGKIIAKGLDVTVFSVDDRVAGLIRTGGYAKYAVVESSQIINCPKHISADHVVAMILNYTTAYQMLTRIARVKPGDNILVHGAAGGVGSALIDIATTLDLKIYCTLSDRKWQDIPARFIKSGTVNRINYQSAPFEKTLSKIAPRGMDAVFDPIGGKHLKRSYEVLSAGGQVVSYGFSTAIKNGRRNLLSILKALIQSVLLPSKMITDCKSVAGFDIWTMAQQRPEYFKEDLGAIFNLYQEGNIAPVMAKSFCLEDAAKAQDLMATSELAGKITLVMS
mgnify:FL=1